MLLDTRIHRFICNFQEPNVDISAKQIFHRAALSACGTLTFLGMPDGTVTVWRTETGLILAEYHTETVEKYERNGTVASISYHPHDHIVAFVKWGSRQTVDLYIWDHLKKPVNLHKVADFYIEKQA